MTKTRVLISILNWNKAQETLECVKSLQSELLHSRAGILVLVIDNGSNESDCAGLEEGLKTQSCLLKKLPVNLGFTGGHNVSIKMAIDEGYDFIWLLNNDAMVEPGALETLLESMQLNPKCGAASPVIYNADDEHLISSCLRTHDWKDRRYHDANTLEEARRTQSESPETVWLVGTAIFFRVQALKQVGLLDDRFFAYYDDDDIGVRLARKGWYSQCVFAASVAHCAKRVSGQYPLYFYYLMQRNSLLFWYKHTPSRNSALLWVKLVDQALFNVTRLYQKGLIAQGDAALLGASDFIFSRFGPPAVDRKIPFALRVLCKISAIYNTKKLM